MVVDPGTVDGLFLYYQLSSRRDEFFRLGSGGSRTPILKKSLFESLKVILPPLPEQRAIAKVLGALDDKIELNREMNRTLEATAQAIFRSWFVDFDPVVAKADGRKPFGLSNELAALFPDRFVESELGAIPEGWRVMSLQDIVELSRNGLKPLDFPKEIFAHYSIPAHDAGKRPILAPGDSIKSSKYLIDESAVLLSKLNPAIERVWLPGCAQGARQICSTEFLVCKPTRFATREHLVSLFHEPGFRSELTGLATGTSNSHQRVRPKDFLQIKTCVPPRDLIELFAKTVEPALVKTVQSRDESENLAALRDLLLPKLLSGEIRVLDTEEEVEEVL